LVGGIRKQGEHTVFPPSAKAETQEIKKCLKERRNEKLGTVHKGRRGTKPEMNIIWHFMGEKGIPSGARLRSFCKEKGEDWWRG